MKGTIIQERFVDLVDLKDTFFPNCFEGKGWEKLLNGLPRVCEPLIREFYSNVNIREDELDCWVRGHEFTLDTCGDQSTPEILFRLKGLGLWPNNPVRGRGHIRGQSVTKEMKIVLREEVKCIYSGPKCIRGECSSRNFCPRWLETFSFL